MSYRTFKRPKGKKALAVDIVVDLSHLIVEIGEGMSEAQLLLNLAHIKSSAKILALKLNRKKY